ncbi:MAG: cell division transport system ATP-binding protein FtsE [Bacteroidetes bacterium HLUCCA01]|nr:MAG: cell division transport system ATP-binding protein FtsE [Bacteroidetes bacterium HLUCCA01]
MTSEQAEDTAVISFDGVSVTYESRLVLNQVDFRLRNGEFVYLIGQTGAGKSSFLKLIYREVLPAEGRVRVDEYDLGKMSNRQVPFLRRKLGIVFQDFQLLPDRSVYENVAFALEVTGNSGKFIKQRVVEVLSMVGLSNKRNQYPAELSGGEQQRVVIARALANEPRIMLADEPTGNLDPDASASIMELLQQINNRGMAVLMVTHNYDLVRQFPYRTIRINSGKLQDIPQSKIIAAAKR